MYSQAQADFSQALGESFGDCISPPVPFEAASPHECCEAVWAVLGDTVTPAQLASLSDADIVALAHGIGAYFETDAPSVQQVAAAVAETLFRWPVGSPGDDAASAA